MLRLFCLAAALFVSTDAFAPVPNAAPASRLTTLAISRSASPVVMAAKAAPKKKAVVKKAVVKKAVVKKVIKKPVKKVIKKAASKPKPKPVAKKAPPKPKPKPKPVAKKAPPKPKPKPKPRAVQKKSFAFGKMQARSAPKLKKTNPARFKGSDLTASGGAANPGGAAFAAFFLFIPWVGIFAKGLGYVG